jgi:hypothetical protein
MERLRISRTGCCSGDTETDSEICLYSENIPQKPGNIGINHLKNSENSGAILCGAPIALHGQMTA